MRGLTLLLVTSTPTGPRVKLLESSRRRRWRFDQSNKDLNKTHKEEVGVVLNQSQTSVSLFNVPLSATLNIRLSKKEKPLYRYALLKDL